MPEQACNHLKRVTLGAGLGSGTRARELTHGSRVICGPELGMLYHFQKELRYFAVGTPTEQKATL